LIVIDVKCAFGTFTMLEAVALNKPELQSSVVAISVSTILSNTFLTKLTLTGDVLHEPQSIDAGLKNNTLQDLTLNFKVISADALQALANFTNLERLTIRTPTAADIRDSDQGRFLIRLLRLPRLCCLSLNCRIHSPVYAERVVAVLRDHNHLTHTLHGVVLDLDSDAAQQRVLQEKIHFYLKLNRYGRDLRRSSMRIPWSRVLANVSNIDENHDVLFDNVKAIASLIVSKQGSNRGSVA
jgi:hypothetical protein